MKKFIIGRSGDQPFKIDDTCDGVSRRHASITITDDGEWELEDIKGPAGNGTFVREPEEEEWQPVLRRRITPRTMVRLSQFHSFVFMAHRVVQEPNKYTYEFQQMLDLWRKLTAEIGAEERRIAKRKKLSYGVAGGGMLLALGIGILQPVVGGVAGLGALSSPLIMSRMFLTPDAKRLGDLKLKRARLVTCPRCGRPLSEADVNNLMCSICKAT